MLQMDNVVGGQVSAPKGVVDKGVLDTEDASAYVNGKQSEEKNIEVIGVPKKTMAENVRVWAAKAASGGGK
ncbi:hypothetical protein OIU76_023221 [Salix suchowensis]|nr:hypothetical protein OIU76_023221 [Salix suchowensis]